MNSKMKNLFISSTVLLLLGACSNENITNVSLQDQPISQVNAQSSKNNLGNKTDEKAYQEISFDELVKISKAESVKEIDAKYFGKLLKVKGALNYSNGASLGLNAGLTTSYNMYATNKKQSVSLLRVEYSEKEKSQATAAEKAIKTYVNKNETSTIYFTVEEVSNNEQGFNFFIHMIRNSKALHQVTIDPGHL